MVRRPVLLFAIAAALRAPTAFAATDTRPSQSTDAAPKVDPQAKDVLRKMSDYLSGLESFTFTTQSFDEAVTKDGQKLQLPAEQQVAVKRPNKLRSDKVEPGTSTVFRYDGKQFSLYGKKTGYYAVAPAPGQLDQAIDTARDRFGIDAPAADLLESNPFTGLMADVKSGRYLGLETIGGVPCHHLAFRNAEVDWQIWVQDGPQPLPRRYQITSKTVVGQPEFAVDISNWKPGANLSDDLFAFKPPPDAKKVELEKPPALGQG